MICFVEKYVFSVKFARFLRKPKFAGKRNSYTLPIAKTLHRAEKVL